MRIPKYLVSGLDHLVKFSIVSFSLTLILLSFYFRSIVVPEGILAWLYVISIPAYYYMIILIVSLLLIPLYSMRYTRYLAITPKVVLDSYLFCNLFVLDIFNGEELTRKYKNKNLPAKQKEYPSFFLLQKRTVSPKGERLSDLWTIEGKANSRLSIFEHDVRLYECGKLERMLKKTGFVVKKVYGGYEKENFSSESLRLILVTFAK